MKSQIVSLLLVYFVCAVVSTSAFGATWSILPIGTGDFATIQASLARATVIVLGRIGRPTVVDDVPYVRVLVEKVLKGPREEWELRV